MNLPITAKITGFVAITAVFVNGFEKSAKLPFISAPILSTSEAKLMLGTADVNPMYTHSNTVSMQMIILALRKKNDTINLT